MLLCSTLLRRFVFREISHYQLLYSKPRSITITSVLYFQLACRWRKPAHTDTPNFVSQLGLRMLLILGMILREQQQLCGIGNNAGLIGDLHWND